MLFSNTLFILYFLPAAFIIYHLFFFSHRIQNVVLLLICLAIYSIGQTVFVFILLFSIVLNWGAAYFIEKYSSTRRIAKIIAAAAAGINLGVLFFFKQLNPILLNNFSETNLVLFLRLGLPLGLSYFTLQGLSYLADVYRGDLRAEKNPIYLGLYLSFFPKMVAGPLISYGAMKEQIRFRSFSLERISRGFCRFTIGLAKFVLVGNSMGRISDYIFAWSAMGPNLFNVPVLLAWIGLLAFMLKLYHQLSGYCDMAIGLAMMLEYRLPENFNYPFMASSLMEFWQRWNITVLGWFRNYLYPFLRGFSRKIINDDIILLNLFITWFMFALWHGTSWSIQFWGALQFIFLTIEHFSGFLGARRGTWYARIYTLGVLILSFVFLKTENLYVAGSFFKNLFGLSNNGFFSDIALVFFREYWIWFILGIISCFPVVPWLRKCLEPRMPKIVAGAGGILYPILIIGLLLITFTYISQESWAPFEYY